MRGRKTKASNLDTLTDMDIMNYKVAFDLIDRTKDGDFDLEEFCIIMDALDMPVNKEDMLDLLKAVDPDGKGNLDFTDFLTYFSENKFGTENAQARKNVFDVFNGKKLEKPLEDQNVLILDDLIDAAYAVGLGEDYEGFSTIMKESNLATKNKMT